MKFRYSLFIILPLLSFFSLSAQKSHIEDEMLLDEKFDGFKALDIQYEYLSPSDYRMKMNDKTYEKGRVNSLQRFNATASMPLIFKQSFIFYLSGRYNYQANDFGKVKTQDVGIITPTHHLNEEWHRYAMSASFVVRGKLFGKNMVYIAGITADGSHGFETMYGALAATMVLKKDKYTSMSIGLYGTTLSSSIFPFFPLFTYTHRFASGWTFDSVLPQRAHLRNVVGRNGRFSGGFLLDSNTFYIYPRDKQNFSHNYTYNQVDMRLEVVYEHFLTKQVLFNVHAGVNKCYKGALRQKYKSSDIVVFRQDANIFASIGFSYKL